MAKTYPLFLAPVPWSEHREYICGWHDGVPLLRRGCAPRDLLATYRQLRALGRRPGGRDYVAKLVTKHRKSAKTNFSSLWLIADAAPVRPMTPAKYAALERAMQARKTCRYCGEVQPREVPKRTGRVCLPCNEALEVDVEAADPWSYIHDYLVGTPTLSAAEHQELDEDLAAERLAPVIPLQRDRELVAAGGRTAVSA